MIERLTPALVETVAASMKGKRLEKLLASVAVINESLALGGWIKLGKVKATSGFYQGLSTARLHTDHHGLSMCLGFGSTKYGRGYLGKGAKFIADLSDEELAKVCNTASRKGATVEIVRAWINLCVESDAAHKELDAARPLPVITAIGLSPKVTKTLTESNLDLDVGTIKMPPIAYRMVKLTDNDGNVVLDKETKEPVMVRHYYPDWPMGTLHGESRFAMSGSRLSCEACSKTIPSGRFVPIMAKCKRLDETVSLWVGTDCAKNIFGIKDVGIAKEEPGGN